MSKLSLQIEIGNLEKTRSILAEEVIKLNNLNDDLEEKVKEIPSLRVQMKVSIRFERTQVYMYCQLVQARAPQ